MIDNINGLAGGDISVCYDKTVLRAVDVSSDPGVILVSSVIEPGVVRMAFATVDAFSDHRIAEIQFHILANDISPLKIGKAELPSIKFWFPKVFMQLCIGSRIGPILH